MNMPVKRQIMGEYRGYSSKGYHFKLDTADEVVFNKCDRSLIDQFELLNQASNNKNFTVDYWEIEPANDPFGIPTRIIFDLKIRA